MVEPLSHRLSLDDEGEPDDFPGEAASSAAVAEYLGYMIGELESLARRAGLDLLTYLLSLARVEAEANRRTDDDERRPARINLRGG